RGVGDFGSRRRHHRFRGLRLGGSRGFDGFRNLDRGFDGLRRLDRGFDDFRRLDRGCDDLRRLGLPVGDRSGRDLLRPGVRRLLGLDKSRVLRLMQGLGLVHLLLGRHGRLCLRDSRRDRLLLRNDRFCSRSPVGHRRRGRRVGGDRGAPWRHARRGHVEVFGAGGGRAGVTGGAGQDGGGGRAAVGEGADRAGGGVGGGRAHVQRAAGDRRLRDGRPDWVADGA
ncbi:hypothetical protein STRIP9103_01574, partial [Streptomyces ipomoeae 91-03]